MSTIYLQDANARHAKEEMRLIAPNRESLIPLVPDFVQHVSIKCEGCPERLGFSFTEVEDEASEQDYAMFQKGWERRIDGVYCPRCLPSVVYQAVL